MNWTISYQGKDLLKKKTENVEKNTITLSKSKLAKAGSLKISFNQIDTASNITLLVNNENNSGLRSWDSVTKSITISNAELKRLFLDKKKIIFYYTAIPKDPQKAMVVRIRPVHVCTLLLQ